jgi:DNA-binding transcriptional regulator GbsR (MarR family)
MRLPELTPATARIVEWLGALGPRWGLPAEPCRVHGLLYLLARPVPAETIAARLALDLAEVTRALEWLANDRLARETPAGWSTETDPWTLMMHALELRRTRELVPARAVLDAWRRESEHEDQVVAAQVRRLASLVDDVAAIDAGARHLSPATVRRLVGLGGRASRLIDFAMQGRRGR